MAVDIEPRRCALIVVDLVNDIVKPGAPLEAPEAREVLVPKLKPLLELARARGVTLVYTRFVRESGETLRVGSEGVEFYAEIGPSAGEIIVNKARYSAFYETDLDLAAELRRRGVDTVIISGCSTAVGCEAAARDAHTKGFDLIFLSDGTVTREIPDIGLGVVAKDEVRKVVLSLMAQRFGTLLSIEELTAALARQQ